jgi:hypothetical protein
MEIKAKVEFADFKDAAEFLGLDLIQMANDSGTANQTGRTRQEEPDRKNQTGRTRQEEPDRKNQTGSREYGHLDVRHEAACINPESNLNWVLMVTMY